MHSCGVNRVMSVLSRVWLMECSVILVHEVISIISPLGPLASLL